jgi:hypothetical protein
MFFNIMGSIISQIKEWWYLRNNKLSEEEFKAIIESLNYNVDYEKILDEENDKSSIRMCGIR